LRRYPLSEYVDASVMPPSSLIDVAFADPTREPDTEWQWEANAPMLADIEEIPTLSPTLIFGIDVFLVGHNPLGAFLSSIFDDLFALLGVGEVDFGAWLEGFNAECAEVYEEFRLALGGFDAFPDAKEQRLADNPQWLEPVDIIDRIDELVNEQLEAGRELL
jgi:hypothetical protein